MALGAVMAAALTTHAARSKALWVGGVDVVKEPASPSRYGTPIESVRVTEVGPGAVSNMSFRIEDAFMQITVSDGMEVLFQDITNDRPYFYGFVDSVEMINRPGDQGRFIDVECTGIEAIIDWAVLTADYAVTAGTPVADAIQAAAALANGTGGLRAFASTGGSASTRPLPIASAVSPWTVSQAVTLSAGTSLREAITTLLGLVVISPVTSRLAVTVDFFRGLRVFLDTPTSSAISGYESWVVNDDSTAFGLQGEPTMYGFDAATVRSVFVRGTAVTAYVTDGSGKPGPTAYLADTSLTTADACIAAGTAYLAAYGTVIRGSITYTDRADWAGGEGSHPGSSVTITDTRLGLSSSVQKVAQFDRAFRHSGRQDWVVSFGSRRPSMVQQVRRLTRGTRS